MPFEGAQRVPGASLTLYIRRGFADAAACAALCAAIDAGARPSTIADDPAADRSFRTSSTCDLDPRDAVVAALDARICAWAGLDPAHGEPMQGQRYLTGQEFKPHTDYFERSSPDYDANCAVPGQRTWTAMLYLNEPTAGGATRFRAIDKIVRPETGKLLCWSNLRDDGTPNPATLHQGMPVRAGAKYVVTKWFRERAWRG